MQALFGDPFAPVREERFSLRPEEILDGVDSAHNLSFFSVFN
jgi:hypothetical protein